VVGHWGGDLLTGRLVRERRPKAELTLVVLNLATYALAAATLLASR
jgi:hypothetical protein